MSLTNKYERDTLDAMFGDNSITGSTHHVGLVKLGGVIAEDGTVADEVTGGDYARVEIANNITNWPAATTDGSDETSKKNGEDIEFPEATADWGEITHFFIATSASGTGDDVIGYGSILVPREIKTGDIARFKSEELAITLD